MSKYLHLSVRNHRRSPLFAHKTHIKSNDDIDVEKKKINLNLSGAFTSPSAGAVVRSAPTPYVAAHETAPPGKRIHHQREERKQGSSEEVF